MSRTTKTLSCCLLLLTLGTGCGTFGIGGGDSGPGSGSAAARTVQFYNCTHPNGPGQPPSGHAFNVWVLGNDNWKPAGGLNTVLGDWTDCHDASHNDPASGATLTLDLASFTAPEQDVEIHLIPVARSDELQCDSSKPDVQNACSPVIYFYTFNPDAAPVVVDVTDANGNG